MLIVVPIAQEDDIVEGEKKEEEEEEDEEEEEEDYAHLYSSDCGGEGDSLNEYVMCYLKGRHRKIGIFKINPPYEGTFFLKVYAKPEDDILNEVDDTLDHIATFTIHVQDVSTFIIFKQTEIRRNPNLPSRSTCLLYTSPSPRD